MTDDIVFPKDEKAISIVRGYKDRFQKMNRQHELAFYSSIHHKLLSEAPISHSDVLFLIRVTSSKFRNLTSNECDLTSGLLSLLNGAFENSSEYHCDILKEDASYLVGFLVAYSYVLEA